MNDNKDGLIFGRTHPFHRDYRERRIRMTREQVREFNASSRSAEDLRRIAPDISEEDVDFILFGYLPGEYNKLLADMEDLLTERGRELDE